MPHINRRNWLGQIGATVAATTLSAGASKSAQAATGQVFTGSFDTDVIVIGGGYAGLACARALVKAGRQVMLLEARDRAGGRCMNMPLPYPYQRFVVEAGAEFIGPTQDRMYELVKELGLSTFAANDVGQQISYLNGTRRAYSGVLPWTNLIATGEVGLAMLKLDSLAKQVPIDTPWTATRAHEWDAQTAQDWIDANTITQTGRQQLRLAVLALLSTEPRDISFLFLLAYLRRGGGLSLMLSTTGGAQQDRIVGGSQAIALAMARTIQSSIAYGAAVRSVVQQPNGVEVSGDQFTVRGQRVVVAMAPAMTAGIRFAPLDGLMQQRVQLSQRVPMGAAWKVHCVYDRPFWRDNGLSGQCISDAFLPKIIFDNTPPEAGAPGVLMGFIDGQDARDASLMTPAARKQNVLDAMKVYFGPKAATPTAYGEMNWQAETFSGGGPVGVFPPGVLTGFGPALRAPIGRVHWAGTETAGVWMGYMEGAVRSGEQAAKDVLAK
jgi:monoamine oxidase